MKPRVEPLSAAAFAPFGDLIEAGPEAECKLINQGFSQRFHDLARLDLSAEQGRASVNIFRTQPMPMPLTLRVLERHPLSSQAFIPLSPNPYLVVVAPAGILDETRIRLFLAQAHQGVNYYPGTWHHFCLALATDSDFLVIDRLGPGINCDQLTLTTPIILSAREIHR